jgi:uncharacterized membrane protein
MTSRTLKALLVVSLVVNVFLVGGIAGGVYRYFLHERVAATEQRGLRFAASELSDERQRQLRQALRDTRRDAQPLIRAARDGRRDLVRILSAPELDRPALDSALASTREADSALRARIEATVAGFATTLTPDERMKLVDAMQRRGPLRGAEAATKK